MTFNGRPSEHVINEIACREGVDPSQLGTPLYDVIDPEALDSIFDEESSRTGPPGIKMKFSYYGYEVIVESPGRVIVQAPAREQATENGTLRGSTVDR